MNVLPDPALFDADAFLEGQDGKGLLRLIVCGSVDHGKSTLIGRLLYESAGRSYLLKLGTASVTARLESPLHLLDLETHDCRVARQFLTNDIGVAVIMLDRPLALDRYADCRETGSFILIDPETCDTIGMGIIEAIEPTEAPGSVEFAATLADLIRATETHGRSFARAMTHAQIRRFVGAGFKPTMLQQKPLVRCSLGHPPTAGLFAIERECDPMGSPSQVLEFCQAEPTHSMRPGVELCLSTDGHVDGSRLLGACHRLYVRSVFLCASCRGLRERRRRQQCQRHSNRQGNN
jgi:hypothetical protein